MSLTAAQLKDRLVSYYVSSWRSNAVLVTNQEMLSGAAQFDHRQDLRQTLSRDLYLSMNDTDCYLRVRCDGSVPADMGLKSEYMALEMFMRENPATVQAMAPLLDKDIEQHGLDGFLERLNVSKLNVVEKVRH